IYFSFEESPAQIMRNMRAIGIHLEKHVRQGLLQFHSARPTVHGLEMHLVRMHKLIEQFNPTTVLVDPVSNLQNAGDLNDSTNMLIRLVDFLRMKAITAFLISLNTGGKFLETTEEGLSSMVDTWLLLRDIEVGGERNRLLYVLKARGIAHSNQVREFLISSNGIKLVDTYIGATGVLTGSARLSQEAREHMEKQAIKEEAQRKGLVFEHRSKSVAAQIAALRAGLQTEKEEYDRVLAGVRLRERQGKIDRAAMAKSRRVDGRKTI
ncbi:MAG TPA: ATPase domain-containing protein, partial [Verrucomicrobiae bacterium]|nr:ATPase domain-containing protein [Verrucomicrobiae bacterium]